MTAYGNMDQSQPGLIQGTGPIKVISRIANAIIQFGASVFSKGGDARQIFPFVADQATIVYSADFSASNVISASVNGTAISAVTYATSHAATFAALVAAIEALEGVTVVSSSATTRTILVETTGVTCTATTSVTGGSAVTATVVFNTSYTLEGVAGSTQKYPAWYAQYDAVNILKEGDITVTASVAVSAGDDVYLTSTGAWTNVATNNLSTGYVFRGNTSGAGIVNIELP